MGTMAATLALTVRDGIEPELTSLSSAVTKASAAIIDLKPNLQHITKKLQSAESATQSCLDDLRLTYDSRFSVLEQGHTNAILNNTDVTTTTLPNSTDAASIADNLDCPMCGKRSTQPNPFHRHPVKDTASHDTTLLPIGQKRVSD